MPVGPHIRDTLLSKWANASLEKRKASTRPPSSAPTESQRKCDLVRGLSRSVFAPPSAPADGSRNSPTAFSPSRKIGASSWFSACSAAASLFRSSDFRPTGAIVGLDWWARDSRPGADQARGVRVLSARRSDRAESHRGNARRNCQGERAGCAYAKGLRRKSPTDEREHADQSQGVSGFQSKMLGEIDVTTGGLMSVTKPRRRRY